MLVPLILAQHRLLAESLQSNHALPMSAVAFMAEYADKLFQIPPRLAADVDMYRRNSEHRRSRLSMPCHQISRMKTIMAEHADKLFQIPPRLAADVDMYRRNGKHR